MIPIAVIIWAVFCLVGMSLFAFSKHEEPMPSVDPGPDPEDLMLIEFQAPDRRYAVLHGHNYLRKCVDMAVNEPDVLKIRIAE